MCSIAVAPSITVPRVLVVPAECVLRTKPSNAETVITSVTMFVVNKLLAVQETVLRTASKTPKGP